MGIAFEEDLAAFFDPEEHGEAILYNEAPIAAIWNRPSGDLETPSGRYRVSTCSFMVPATSVPEPVAGDTIVVTRLALAFAVAGAPWLNADGSIWTCEVEPA